MIGHEQKNCNKERVMSSLGQGVHKYGPRVGVPAAKPIRLIMEELASRKKESTEQKTQSSRTTSGRGRSQAAQVRTIVLQEQLEQKNWIEEEEADGEILSDCVEGTEEEVTSPRTEVLYKIYRETAESFLSRPLRHLSNLRMQSGLPGFRVEPLHFSLEPVLVNGEEEKGQHEEVYEEEGGTISFKPWWVRRRVGEERRVCLTECGG